MLTAPVTIVTARTAEDQRPGEVDEGDDPSPVEAVRDRPGRGAEQELGEDLAQEGERDEERVLRLRGDQERAGGQRDAVADVRDDGLGEEPAEAPAQARGRDDLDDGRERGTHRAAGYRRARARDELRVELIQPVVAADEDQLVAGLDRGLGRRG